MAESMPDSYLPYPGTYLAFEPGNRRAEYHPIQPPTTLFTRPAVVEAIGAGFDRLPNSRLETLRFPRITKVHHDRGFLDAIDFDSYQMARQHRAAKLQ
jgi:DNA ligase-4